eukprot:TRINITY_DN1529_c0_g1_i2.p1 TRINITY_DN1529_c0_g1~~TRINITY_DN1529_c0_g1_i2.p1  ORF type:complete len:431 (-),score=109.83 TRINITY_DN1529_c0_g1_i2:311-1603(-)
MALKCCVLALFLLAVRGAATAVTLKVGGPVQDSYKKPFELWANATNADTNAGFKVELVFKAYSMGTLAADVASMTTTGNSDYVDVFLAPYGSTAVKAAVDAVAADYAGPIMAWGGASDGIFDTNCDGKNCFGFFTVGSQYTTSGLTALDALSEATLSVAVIVNDNAFSNSVADGTETFVGTAAGLNQIDQVTLSVSKTALSDDDKTNIQAAMAKKPDIVVVAGHNLDVEPAIIEIGKGDHIPMAILATNGLTKLENYGADSKYSKCVMMPTQWDSSSSNKDAVVGWTSADFMSAMGGSASYQQAAAGAVGVAISNAMGVSATAASLVSSLQGMDVDSFYGKLKWDSKGKIQKPMYTQQLKGDNLEIVAPSGTVTQPLSSTSCWAGGEDDSGGSTSDDDPITTGSESSSALGLVSMPQLLVGTGLLYVLPQ